MWLNLPETFQSVKAFDCLNLHNLTSPISGSNIGAINSMTIEACQIIIIFLAGCTCDDTDLPHHVSTRNEIIQLMTSSRELLRKVGAKICVVTIARSSLDDFCPQDQVSIQNYLFSPKSSGH
jgi:hypothetical protein